MLAGLVITFMSCNDIEQASPNEAVKWKIPSKYIADYALAYRANQNSDIKYKSGENTNYSICEIDSFVDKNNLTAMYVINFCNDSGWVILSADYRMEPILAHNDAGSFGHGDIPGGLAMWLLTTVESIEYIREHDLRHPTADLAWGVSLEDYDIEDFPSLPNIGINGGKGPADIDPCYGVKNKIATHGPFLNTTWGQGCTYNDDVPNCATGRCGKMPTGCVATACGQIMQFWGHPQATFDFTAMSMNNGNSEVAKLLEDFGDEVNMNYQCDGSGSQSNDAKQCLDNVYNYHDPKFVPYSYTTLMSDLQKDWPVYLDGCDVRTVESVSRKWWELWKPKNYDVVSYEDCHAWVCDGYRYSYRKCPNKAQVSWGNELHMNWGWHEVNATTLASINNDYNGWFKYNDWTIRRADGSAVFNFRFANNMIYNIDR